MSNNKVELVFVPAPGIGHLVSTVEIAKLLIDRDDRLSITVLIMKLSFDSTINAYTDSLAATGRIRYVHLPREDSDPSAQLGVNFITSFAEKQKPHVKKAVAELTRSDSPRLAGFVVDMFSTCMIDVANEFGVPSYLFFTSSAASLGLMFHLQKLTAEQNIDVTEFKNSDAELVVPCYVNPVPAKVLPSVVLDKSRGSEEFIGLAKEFRETKGIIVNSFKELEPHALKSLSEGTTPKVYPVGPILNLKSDAHQHAEIMTWLDDQPSASVVFLCFGSMGSFNEDQVKEIAHALERSGHRFLWSLRKPAPANSLEFPKDYTNFDDVLPEGFLERTAEKGKVIGWAPQVAVLAHEAVGGFVSHCGWNSTLEALWFGVPIATWPLYAEQQMNAFELVKELGLGVEIKMDYRKGESKDVSAEEIEKGIRRVMEHDSELRKKVKDMKEKSRKALMDGGSSLIWLGRFTEDVLDNIP